MKVPPLLRLSPQGGSDWAWRPGTILLVFLRVPSWSFLPLRGYLFSFLPLTSSLFQPLRVPSWITLFPFSPFVDIFFPLPDPWRPLWIFRQPLSGPLPSFVPLRGYVFCPSCPSRTPFDPWLRLPLEPGEPLRASNPFVALSGPSWPFVDIFLLCPSWTLFPFSPFVRPLADPSGSSANPLVALCRSSCPFVDMFLPVDIPFLPLHAPLSSLFQPLRVPSWITLFPFSPFVDIFFPLPDPWRPPLEPPPTP